MKAAWSLWQRLLLDPAARAAFLEDREGALRAAGVAGPLARHFLDLDAVGLCVDGEARARYLMSALCRPYALTAAALGARPGGPEALMAFLSSPHLLDEPGARAAAFGAHLDRLLALGGGSRELQALLGAQLALERALVANAAALRRAAEEGRAPGPPRPPRRVTRGVVALPPFLLVAELPQPTALLQGALDGAGPGDAWHRVASGQLDPGRVETLARAEAVPVTVICRGYVAGMSSERAGAGGVAPLVDVRHARVELVGRQGAAAGALQGQRLGALPVARQALARRLIEAGVLDLGA